MVIQITITISRKCLTTEAACPFEVIKFCSFTISTFSCVFYFVDFEVLIKKDILKWLVCWNLILYMYTTKITTPQISMNLCGDKGTIDTVYLPGQQSW